MKIGEKDIYTALKQYGIEDSLINTYYIIERYKKGINPRARVIVKADVDSEESYIIKFILEEEHPQKLIEEQSIFSESIRESGIITPKRFKCNGAYCIELLVEELNYSVTLEEYIGEELNFINDKVVEEIATLMAKMHLISEKKDLHIQRNTIWDLFNETTDISRGYKDFCEYRKTDIDFTRYDIGLYEKIITLYEERLSRLKNIWPKLPKYATQGDYSINNLVYGNDKIEGIFDYNIAGDEVLVSDMIIEGLLVSYEMDIDNLLTHDDKDRMFKIFVRKYMECRELNQDELNIMNDIYAVVFPFWWTRIIYDEENSLKKHLSDSNVEKVNEFLDDTYKLLKQNYFQEDF